MVEANMYKIQDTQLKQKANKSLSEIKYVCKSIMNLITHCRNYYAVIT